uniref:Uncharacterized protein n=1 Tax=Anguilla anguilla TaxID=7936 RepID=A0A0E9QYQ4_ANGAN
MTWSGDHRLRDMPFIVFKLHPLSFSFLILPILDQPDVYMNVSVRNSVVQLVT